MTELFEAIKTHYSGKPIAAKAPLWPYRAKQDAKLPYVTYMLVSSSPSDTFSDSLDNTLVQFSIWSEQKSPLEVMGLRDLLQAAMDEAKFAVRGHSLVRCKREMERLVEEPGYGYVYHIDYRMQVQ